MVFYFGNLKCFCMSKIPSEDIHLPECDTSPNKTWLAGGGDVYMSIYKRRTDIQSTGNGEKCLTFSFYDHKNHILWKECKSYVRALCKRGGHVFNANHNGQTDYEWRYSNANHNGQGYHCEWRYYVQTCFKNKCFPITYDDIMNSSIVEATGPSWSNVIRSDVIFKHDEFSNVTSQGIKYGYITKSGNTIVLSFESNADLTRRYFIKKVPITSTSSDTSSTSTPSGNFMSTQVTGYRTTNGLTVPLSASSFFSSSSKALVSVTTASFFSSSSSKALVSVTTTSTSELGHTSMSSTEGVKSKTDMLNVESSGSDASVAVSVSVVIVVIIVAAVVIIVILKRRGKIPSLCIKNSTLDKSKKGASDKLSAENNVYVSASQEMAYEQIDELKVKNNVDTRQDLELSYGQHDYFILEPGTRESNTDTDIAESRKHNLEIDDDYNVLHEHAKTDKNVDNTYDTSETAAMKLKNLQTGERMLDETEEDTYNHVDRSAMKTGKTDNIYGIPNNLENDYSDVRKENIRQEEDDTYNHLKPNQ